MAEYYDPIVYRDITKIERFTFDNGVTGWRVTGKHAYAKGLPAELDKEDTCLFPDMHFEVTISAQPTIAKED